MKSVIFMVIGLLISLAVESQELRFKVQEYTFGVDYYELGAVKSINKSRKFKNHVVIDVDTNRRAKEFISLMDKFLKDEEGLHGSPDTDSILKEHQEVYTSERMREVFISNYRDSNVKIQHIDMSLFCTLEFFIQGVWIPQKCQRLSWCGNSYFFQRVPPYHRSSFLFELPNEGNLVLKSRFKILGVNEFYYSNEFSYRVNSKAVIYPKDIVNIGYDGGPYEGSVYCFRKPFNFVVVE